MKKHIISILIILLKSLVIYSQNPDDFWDECIFNVGSGLKSASATHDSKKGYYFPSKGRFYTLNIFVNIIYDKTPENDPCKNSSSNFWLPDGNNSLNIKPPTYLLNFLDTGYNSLKNWKGTMTRLYAEASFDSLLIFGDFMVVNIKQSKINPNPPYTFNEYKLMDAVITFINENGGIKALYNHNSINFYDNATGNKLIKNNKIDVTNFFVRNPTYTFGGVKKGQGIATVIFNEIKINNVLYGIDWITYQGVGDEDLSKDYKCVAIHEFSHLLIGDNSFHTSGGNHFRNTNPNTFLGLQKGYGLLGGASSFVGCNGYERWRLGWRSTYNNAYPISASNINSDIRKEDGNKTFWLRDFMTYGDVIRIKLPYKQNPMCRNQYIWLENHQVGRNNKLDFFDLSDEFSCKHPGTPGIYMYYQVGKDVLEGSSSEVYPSDQTDNLRIISAEGNYDMTYMDSTLDCIGWGPRPRFKKLSPNPFTGANDQTERIDNLRGTNTIDLSYDHRVVGSKNSNNDLPYKGDKFDAFTNGSIYNMASNPAPVTVYTYYSKQYKDSPSSSIVNFKKVYSEKDNRKIYLSGLSIKMMEDGQNSAGKIFKVEIRWDDYDINKSVSWAGDIVLKEKLFLKPNCSIDLIQSKTVNQIERDNISGEFSKTTFFTCDSNSLLVMESNSSINVKEKSSIITVSNSNMKIQDGAVLTIMSGTTLKLGSNTNIQISGTGRIEVMPGAYLCIDSGAKIFLESPLSVINLHTGYNAYANPELFINTNCHSNPKSYNLQNSSLGKINDYTSNKYEQNITYASDTYIAGKNIYAGNNVTNTKPTGNVIIPINKKVIYDSEGEILLDKGFEVQLGAYFEAR